MRFWLSVRGAAFILTHLQAHTVSVSIDVGVDMCMLTVECSQVIHTQHVTAWAAICNSVWRQSCGWTCAPTPVHALTHTCACMLVCLLPRWRMRLRAVACADVCLYAYCVLRRWCMRLPAVAATLREMAASCQCQCTTRRGSVQQAGQGVCGKPEHMCRPGTQLQG